MSSQKKGGRPKKSADDFLRDISALKATLDEEGWAHVEREAKQHRKLLATKATHKKKGFPFPEYEEQRLAYTKQYYNKSKQLSRLVWVWKKL